MTLELYAKDVQLAFDIDEYRALIRRWSSTADNYRVTKPAVDFSRRGGRRAQRAYFEAVRDLVAPSFGWTVLRVPAPECNAPIAADRLMARIREVAQLSTS